MKFILLFQNFIKKFFQVIESLARIFLLSKFRNNISPKRADVEECVILGNGPSLKQDLQNHPDFLKGKDLICVNLFPSTELYEQLKPTAFVTTAPDLWLEDIEERFIGLSTKMFNDMATKTTWPMELHIPFESSPYKRWRNQLAGNKNIFIRYFNNVPIEGWDWFKHYCFDRKWGMPRPHNVMVSSLMVCLWKNYKTIYLLGADHSWLKEISVTENNEVLINQKHFYDEHESKSLPLDKRGKGKRNLSELLHKFMTAFASYFEIKKYAAYRGAKIINVTRNSFIDAFERGILN